MKAGQHPSMGRKNVQRRLVQFRDCAIGREAGKDHGYVRIGTFALHTDLSNQSAGNILLRLCGMGYLERGPNLGSGTITYKLSPKGVAYLNVRAL